MDREKKKKTRKIYKRNKRACKKGKQIYWRRKQFI